MSEREQTPMPPDKEKHDAREKTVPTFLPPAREQGDEEVLRLMRAL